MEFDTINSQVSSEIENLPLQNIQVIRTQRISKTAIESLFQSSFFKAHSPLSFSLQMDQHKFSSGQHRTQVAA